MKRFHVHVGVGDLEQSIRFYTGLFGAEPSVRKSGYAKWMVDDPRVNFAISQRAADHLGVNHLGLQAESPDELAAIRTGFSAADSSSLVDEPDAHCCYVRSDKHWVTDPQGITWEAFHTLEPLPFFGAAAEPSAKASPCCAPTSAAMPGTKTEERATRTSCCQ